MRLRRRPPATTYRNTLTLRLGRRSYLAKPPTGPAADAWDQLRAEYPHLDGARVCDTGQLDVELERTMAPADDRVRLVHALFDRFGADAVETYRDKTWTTHWTMFSYAGVTVIVYTKVCDCHPGTDAMWQMLGR